VNDDGGRDVHAGHPDDAHHREQKQSARDGFGPVIGKPGAQVGSKASARRLGLGRRPVGLWRGRRVVGQSGHGGPSHPDDGWDESLRAAWARALSVLRAQGCGIDAVDVQAAEETVDAASRTLEMMGTLRMLIPPSVQLNVPHLAKRQNPSGQWTDAQNYSAMDRFTLTTAGPGWS